MNKYEQPLIVLSESTGLFQEIRTIVRQNSDTIYIIEDENLAIKIIHNIPLSGFTFKVFDPKIGSSAKVTWKCYKRPYHHIDLKPRQFENEKKSVLSQFTNWIDLIKQYDASNPNLGDKILKEYEEEIAENIKLIDEDADITTFRIEIQIAVNTFYEEAIKYLEEHQPEEQELIQEAKLNKDAITTSSKQGIWRGLVKFMARVRKIGIKEFQEIGQLFKKELYKKGISFLISKGIDLFLS